MKILRRSAPAVATHDPGNYCEACRTTGHPREWATVDGIPMQLCTDAGACRRRWEADERSTP